MILVKSPALPYEPKSNIPYLFCRQMQEQNREPKNQWEQSSLDGLAVFTQVMWQHVRLHQGQGKHDFRVDANNQQPEAVYGCIWSIYISLYQLFGSCPAPWLDNLGRPWSPASANIYLDLPLGKLQGTPGQLVTSCSDPVSILPFWPNDKVCLIIRLNPLPVPLGHCAHSVHPREAINR